MNGLEEPSNRIFVKKKNLEFWVIQGGGSANSQFLPFFSKTKFALEQGPLFFFMKILFFYKGRVWDLEFF